MIDGEISIQSDWNMYHFVTVKDSVKFIREEKKIIINSIRRSQNHSNVRRKREKLKNVRLLTVQGYDISLANKFTFVHRFVNSSSVKGDFRCQSQRTNRLRKNPHENDYRNCGHSRSPCGIFRNKFVRWLTDNNGSHAFQTIKAKWFTIYGCSPVNRFDSQSSSFLWNFECKRIAIVVA